MENRFQKYKKLFTYQIGCRQKHCLVRSSSTGLAFVFFLRLYVNKCDFPSVLVLSNIFLIYYLSEIKSFNSFLKFSIGQLDQQRTESFS